MGQTSIQQEKQEQFFLSKFYWNVSKHLRSIIIKACCCSIITVLLIFCIFPFPHAALKTINYSQSILDNEGNILRVFLNNGDNWLLPCSLAEINPILVNATLAIEDSRYYNHFGVDFPALVRAIKLNLTNKRIISGASTISMQVVGLLEHKDRTFFNKIVEAVHAVVLEIFYSKAEILQFYLQLAPYGGNIVGIKAASLRYFNKTPKDLSLAEAALLAGLPQSPSCLRPDRYPAKAKRRRNQVLKSMLKNKLISMNQYRRAIAVDVNAKNYPFPFIAPHFCQFVNSRSKQRTIIQTSLNSNLQNFANNTIRRSILKLRKDGIYNAALIVIENKSGKIRAMVGSRDFFATDDAGQLNGSLCKRYPGSMLKPFTYALGFASGLYTPSSILADIPVQYLNFMPINYDQSFNGLIPLREAMLDSLNIPAVEVLHKIGYQKLYTFMQNAGVSNLNTQPNYYGLALTLDAAKINLLELTNAYSVIARLGIYKPYTFLETTTTSVKPKRILSKEAAYLIADILTENSKCANNYTSSYSKKQVKVAVQTGTANGRRDAWTIAYNPEFTIGVWVGNFSSASAKALVGKKVAFPIAMQVFAWLNSEQDFSWYLPPTNIGYRKVCKASGEAACSGCKDCTKDFYIKHCSLAKKCSQHLEKSEINSKANQPKIILPIQGCEYYQHGSGRAGELALQGTSSAKVKKLYWFINNEFYNIADVDEKIYWPMRKGKHNISCVDELGVSTSIDILVR